MRRQAVGNIQSADLMGEDIIGNFLSKEVLHSTTKIGNKLRRFIRNILSFVKEAKMTGNKLHRFVRDQETIREVRLVGSGAHGVVVLAVIKDVEYALKVVNTYSVPWRILLSSNMCHSSGIGKSVVPCLLPLTKRPFVQHRWRRSAELLLN